VEADFEKLFDVEFRKLLERNQSYEKIYRARKMRFLKNDEKDLEEAY